MATSDIAAYFENIHLELLRDLQNDLLPNEQKIINLFMSAFAAWTYDTIHGKRYLRGIPQGSQISSFFGNIFLKTIDNAFVEFEQKREAKYFRYMDDIRIFTKDYATVRNAIILLDLQSRTLHLNLQTAKTRIFDERDGEITGALIDRRLTQLDVLHDAVNKTLADARKSRVEPDLSPARSRLKHIYERNPPSRSGGQMIKGARKSLRGLSDRVFRRLLTLHLQIGGDIILDRLINEITRNADYRLGLKLIQFARHFPRKQSIQSELLSFIRSERNIFPFQEAQILKAVRYLSRISSDMRTHCLSRAKDENMDAQVRVQALALLSRTALDVYTINIAKRVFADASRTAVRKAASLILVRRRGEANTKFVREMVFHPHNELRLLGRLLREVKNEERTADLILVQAFKKDYEFLLIDYLRLVYLIAESRDRRLPMKLVERIRKQHSDRTHPNMDMRDRLKEVRRFAEQNLQRG